MSSEKGKGFSKGTSESRAIQGLKTDHFVCILCLGKIEVSFVGCVY